MPGSDQTARLTLLRDILAHAYDNAPAVRALFAQAGAKPGDIASVADLTRLPVTSKERLHALQREQPPFGGFLAVPGSALERIFVSPGPIYDPQLRGDDESGLAAGFAAAGLGPGDIILNTWSYHLVPAGLMLDHGMRATGATVVPGGTGNTEIQARAILDLGVTAICASTGFFQALADAIEASGTALPAGWRVRRAILGGEFGDWMAKRKRLESRYGIETFALYATGDVGVVAVERRGQPGYSVIANRIVQICDPATGLPVPAGEPGEIVVTALTRGYPLVRLGTGDVSRALEMSECGGCALVIAPLTGRVGQAVKAREIFIYPHQLAELARQIPAIDRLQATITRPRAREEVHLAVVLHDPDRRAEAEAELNRLFPALTRLRIDGLRFLPPGSLAADAPLLLDRKDAPPA